ncbi:MAG TPA: antibiotic biosynthesis monooxygenase [Gemmatimonadales bacterium]|nr:antibiotic biosynthesis monooxygenase [Gemmatimonadales bacterium]
MYMVIRRYGAKRGTIDELARDVQQNFLPIASNIQGFVSYEFMSEGDDAFCTVSVFESREGAAESTRRAADYVRERFASRGVERRDVIEGELVLHREAMFAGSGR